MTITLHTPAQHKAEIDAQLERVRADILEAKRLRNWTMVCDLERFAAHLEITIACEPRA